MAAFYRRFGMVARTEMMRRETGALAAPPR